MEMVGSGWDFAACKLAWTTLVPIAVCIVEIETFSRQIPAQSVRVSQSSEVSPCIHYRAFLAS
jgi:hypothetical protein